MIPTNINDWRRCIEQDCGILLTPDFLNARLAILSDAADSETKKFIAQYGEVHHANILRWMQQVNDIPINTRNQ